MNFWDSSALLPLVVAEEATPRVLALLDQAEEVVAWTLAPVELFSALARLQREGELSPESFEQSRRSWEEMISGLTLVRDVEAVKLRAIRVLGIHSLKTADALQLASALVACSDLTKNAVFVTLDQRLAGAARREGVQVLP